MTATTPKLNETTATIFAKSFLSVYSLKVLISCALSRRLDTQQLLNMRDGRMALALAGMRATNFALVKSLRAVAGRYSPSVAAAISSLWLLCDSDKNRRVYISLTLAIKSVLFTIRSFLYRSSDDSDAEGHEFFTESTRIQYESRIGRFVSNALHRYGQLAIWFSISFQVCYFAFNYPRLMPKSFVKTLMEMTGYTVYFVIRKSTAIIYNL